MALLLKGAPVAAALNAEAARESAALRERGIEPALAIVRLGEKEGDIAYERGAVKRAAAVGVSVRHVVLPEDTNGEALTGTILSLNEDSAVHGVILLRPLPPHIDGEAIRNSLSPAKDIDGITDASLAGVFAGSASGFAPCTARACIELLDFYHIDCTGKRAVVIGRSLVAGRPAAMLLLARNATVTICHSRTADLKHAVSDAEIVIAALGKKEALGAGYFRAGQVVLDVGINWDAEKGRITGDVNFVEAEALVAAISPAPGGVGAVTTSVLMKQVVQAARTAQ
jgi:methylenetetrahydrofolate dehydrogenase (NADP+)/methenyltetrahydrofolate cyclohydrolase